MKKIFLAVNVVLMALLAFFFLRFIDLDSLSQAVKNADFPLLLLAAFFYFLVQFVNFIRLGRIIGSYSKGVFFSHFAGVAASDYTPGRLGYSLAFLAMKKLGIPVSKNLKAGALVFATDFASRAVFALAIVALFSPSFLPVVILLLLAAAFLFAVFFRKSAKLSWLLSKIPFAKERLSLLYEAAVGSEIAFSEVVICFALSVVGAFLRGASWTLIFIALGFKAEPAFALVSFTLFSSVITIISIIPVSLSGIGVQEATGAFVLSNFLGLPIQVAAAGLIISRAIELSVDLIFATPWFARNFKG